MFNGITILCSLGLVLYFFVVGSHLGKKLIPKESRSAQAFWGSLALLLLLLLANTIVYYVYGMNRIVSWILLLIPLCIFFLTNKKSQKFSISTPCWNKPLIILAIFFLANEVFLLFPLYQARTLEAMPSPWQALGKNFFLLYTLGTVLLFLTIQKTKSSVMHVALTIPHLFITYTVAAIIYPLGFGFDGVIHRATETWINTHGSIAPKNPFYIGQYSLVVWLHHITQIPIFFIDVYLVPLLASITLPQAVLFTLKRVWGISSVVGARVFWLLPGIFFISFNLTTPHNLVLLFTALTVFSTLCYLNGNLPAKIPLLLAISGLATHPLIGAPVCAFVLAALLVKKIKSNTVKKSVVIILPFAIALIPVSLFVTFLFLTGHGLPQFSNPFAKINHFLDLFAWPYWIAPKAPFIFELLYTWSRLIAPLTVLLGIIGWVVVPKKDKEFWLVPGTVLGLFLGALLLRSWVVFPNVPSAEQGDYPLRLIRTSLLFVLPWSMYSLYRLSLMGRRYHIGPIAVTIAIITFATLSFYLSYPQRNPKAQFPGYSMTIHDFHAVEWIHNANTSTQYIVLGNPLVSAAALEKYSFAKYFDTKEGQLFYYAIPTGGPLFTHYLEMIYQGQKRSTMDAAMDLAGVKKAYFVMNDYWKNYNQIVETAKITADFAQPIDDGKIWILGYER